MLSIGKMVARSEDYYLQSVANGREEYYTGSGEAPGYWLGRGAERLELSGQVAPADLRAVLAGVSPRGEILNAGRVAEAHRVAGFDLTFSAPKSVSLLYGLSDPDVSRTVRAIHTDAVSQALGYLERRALRLRRGAGGEQRVEADGLVAAAFMHRTSRAGDPQLHTHVLVANVAQGMDDTWSAPDGRLIYFHARTAGFLYEAALRAGLTKSLGVAFGPVSRGIAELDGVPKTLLRSFSTRRREIERHLAQVGEYSAKAAQVAVLATRAPKETARELANGPGLRKRWLDQAADLGFADLGRGVTVLDGLLGARMWSPPSGARIAEVVDQVIGPAGLTAGAAAFERRDVVRALADALSEGAPVELVESMAEAALARPEVAALASVGRGGELRHTTLDLLEVERRLLREIAESQGAGVGTVSADTLATALCRFPLLAPEQVDMVRRLVTSGHGTEAVVGKAGSGKTLALAAAHSAWEAHGSRVIGTALSARAARGLHDGAGMASDTLARLLKGLTNGTVELSTHDVVVLDEAGMVGTRDLAALIDATGRAGAKAVLVGDPRQLPEIAAGGAFAAIVGRIGSIELTENRRQNQAWERSALDALRVGRAGLALASYDDAGRIHLAPTMAQAREQLVESWLHSHLAAEDAVMMALTRGEVGALNDAARAALHLRKRLGPDVLEVGETGFAVGDKVVCLRNDRRIGVVNGTVGTVQGVWHGGLAITTAEGPRHLPPRYLDDDHLSHAYALTVHKAQGLTVERAFVLATESLTQEAGYVAMSRARSGTELFVPVDGSGEDLPGHDLRHQSDDPMARTVRRLGTSGAKQLALSELATPAEHVAGDDRTALERSVYREEPQIGGGDGTPKDDPAPAGAEARQRQRASHDAMTLALKTREAIEAERDRGWTTTPTELDRSRGRGR
jgi:conjugative relaxase-like TrwC/TraI family protein